MTDRTTEIVAELRMLARVADEAINEVNLALWEEELVEESRLTTYFWDASTNLEVPGSARDRKPSGSAHEGPGTSNCHWGQS